MPGAKPVAYAGWRAIGFRDAEAGYVGGVFLFNDHVSVIFEHGALLPDPDGILQGETKQTRHIPFAPGDPIREGPLGALPLAAVDICRDLEAARRA